MGDWPDNDHRLFIGDLGNEANDNSLIKVFQHYPSFARAKVIRDKYNGKSKGFGFVSFTDANDCAQAIKEMNGKYCGNRPMKIRKSESQKRDITESIVQKDVDVRRQVKKLKKQKSKHLY